MSGRTPSISAKSPPLTIAPTAIAQKIAWFGFAGFTALSSTKTRIKSSVFIRARANLYWLAPTTRWASSSSTRGDGLLASLPLLGKPNHISRISCKQPHHQLSRLFPASRCLNRHELYPVGYIIFAGDARFVTKVQRPRVISGSRLTHLASRGARREGAAADPLVRQFFHDLQPWAR